MFGKKKQLLENRETSVGIVGLGYVGLPLACLLAKKFKVVGFDTNPRRVSQLKSGIDKNLEVKNATDLKNANLSFTCSATDLGKCPIVIVAVPTPIDNFKNPDLSPLRSASETIATVLEKDVVVVFESTVYPGVTEDVCGPLIEKISGLKQNKEFFLGYSPERVNPGDTEHTTDKIIKVVSGSTREVTEFIAWVYSTVITAGVFKAASIKTAEAAKVIENTQRDLNIALVNELAMLFERVGLDTLDVLEAAGTKWNFLPFRPGLVGGHCIGVDPYYLTHMAEGLGFHTNLILAGRRINDDMGPFIANKTIMLMMQNGASISDAAKLKVGILGVTFKENVPDVRNTKVIDVIQVLERFGVQTYLVDPVADAGDFEEEYGRSLVTWEDLPVCDAIIVAVKHEVFLKTIDVDTIIAKLNERKIIVDLKGVYDRDVALSKGAKHWRL